MTNRALQNLRRLAAAHGVQLSYRAMDGRRKHISGQTLGAVLKCLGVPAEICGGGASFAGGSHEGSLGAMRACRSGGLGWQARAAASACGGGPGDISRRNANCAWSQARPIILSVPLPDIRTVGTGEVAGKRYPGETDHAARSADRLSRIDLCGRRFFLPNPDYCSPHSVLLRAGPQASLGNFPADDAARSDTDWGAGNFATGASWSIGRREMAPG